MEYIASLREQLDGLCARPSVDPNWMLTQLSTGLRARYGRVGVGFVRRRLQLPDHVQLLGLADADGRILVPISEEFRADRRHPDARAESVITEAWVEATHFGIWDNAEVDACMASFRAAFLTPWLIDKPADWHILVLSPIAAPGQLRQDRGLSVTANLLATNLLRALDARRLARANEWIEREMDEIARLQALLQPDEATRVEGVDVAFSSEIYHYAGGDYFDIPVLTHLIDEADRVPGQDHWGAIIADVSGHGPSAAVEAAMLDAIMRTYPGPVGSGPGAVATYVNRYLFTRRPRASFVSAFIANYDPRARQLSYVNCGHPRPLYRWADGSVGDLAVETGIPLRIERDAEWPVTRRCMDPGDLLVLVTDGVIETRSPAGEHLGRAGLRRVLDTLPESATAADVLTALRAGILSHQDGRPPQDDETIIVLRFEGAPAGAS